MRILANENFPRVAVEAPRARSHDVLWARTDSPGAADVVVLDRAVREGRVLLTFDKDFGELAFRYGLPASSGVILFRIPPDDPLEVARRAVALIDSRADWAGHFSIVDDKRLRMVPLPEPKAGRS